MKRSAVPLIILLVMTSVFLVFSLIPPKRLTALASSTETFTFNFARNITTFSPNFQNITNTYGFTVNIRIYIQTVDSITLFKKFILTVNDTTFINIINGVIIQTENIFYGLRPLETLIYNASATPIPTINNTETAKITYITEIYEHVITPPPPPPIVYHIFDVKITAIPTTITYILVFKETFQATVNILNKGIDTDTTLEWKLLDMQGSVISSEKLTIFLKSSENKTLTLTIPTPGTPGTYTLKAEVISPAFATSQKTFTVIIFPLTVIIAITALVTLLIVVLILRKTRKI